MMSKYPELKLLMDPSKKTNLSMMLTEQTDDGVDLEVLDAVQVKYEGSTARCMRGTIVIKKRAIKDRKFLQWIQNRELYKAWEEQQKVIRYEENAKKKKALKKKRQKVMMEEEEKELNTCDIANDQESPDTNIENMKLVKKKLEEKKKADFEAQQLEKKR